MKTIIDFFKWIYYRFIQLLKRKGLKPIEPVAPKTLTEKMEEISSKKSFHHRQEIPPHNNRSSKRNKRGARSRFTQYTPSGKAIFHTVIKSPTV